MSASLAPPRNARSYLADALRLSSNQPDRNRAVQVRPEAVALLSEVMARLHGIQMPVVQFILASGKGTASEVAHSFAQASALRLGRTLLLRLDVSRGMPWSAGTAQVAAAGRSARKSPGNVLATVPDSAVPELYHAYIGSESGEALQIGRVLPETWLDNVALDFRLVVVAGGAPDNCPATLDLATRCHGSILVVTAGVTSPSQLRTVTRHVQLAGGTLLGSVLHDAPPAPRVRILPWENNHSATPKK